MSGKKHDCARHRTNLLTLSFKLTAITFTSFPREVELVLFYKVWDGPVLQCWQHQQRPRRAGRAAHRVAVVLQRAYTVSPQMAGQAWAWLFHGCGRNEDVRAEAVDRQHHPPIAGAIATLLRTANPIITKIQEKNQTAGIKSSSQRDWQLILRGTCLAIGPRRAVSDLLQGR